MNYTYDFQGTKLVHRPAKGHTDFKPPKQKAAPHRRGLDPEDLTRRLQFVIAERKAIDAEKRRSRTVPSSSSRPFRTQEFSEAKSLRRRTAALDSPKDKRRTKGVDHHSENSLAARFRRRASKAALDEQQNPADLAASNGPYVPRVAASQFADTTLGESPPDKSQIHKLSRAALKYHMDGINGDFQVASTAVPGAAPIKQAQALRRAQTLRERNYDRNQFQASSMPDNLEPVITSPTLFKRRSIYTAHTSEEKQLRASRRKSTGSFLGGDSSSSPRQSVFAPPLNPTDLAAVAEAHRVDWTQSDEATATPPPRPKSTSPTQSTKGESRWKFRGRLNSFHRNKEEKTPSPPADGLELPKSPIAALFARFRR
ncbi:hypothetical protein ISF_05671 [Cordyceps fumosorosea ARSEF 2679]|uniref:Uncharacterized protein n=1 Tax=Cordyceps fumosorosea (strain ARSEF 2679) TaxID=1081104 RepID=A0A167TIH6_CORFA|nr:hypothetical protein ISF_05671 [Cordyceps fumosorosea ARSEF 2679]OAA60632.1 hypothetical protein ISF_05671 [Cordyceps fumosorosea ARSEF 2679]